MCLACPFERYIQAVLFAASNKSAGQTWFFDVWQQQLSKQKWSQMVGGKSQFMTLLGCTVCGCKYASIVDLQRMHCIASAGAV